MKKRSLTTGEIAEYCRVNFRTVIRWIERGLIRAYQLPGRGDNRVEVEDFVGFLRSNQLPIPDEFLPYCRRVLIVDDEPQLARSIERTLQKAGFETELAFNGFEAGTKLGTFLPSVLTLDLSMPGLDGFGVLKTIAETPQLANVRILVISALPEAELQRAKAMGAHEVMSKPFDNAQLLQAVSQLAGVEDLKALAVE